MSFRHTTSLLLIALCLIGHRASATTDYMVMLDPSTTKTNRQHLMAFYSQLTLNQRLTVLTLDGQVIAQQIGLKRLPNGRISGKEASKLRRFQAQLDEAAKNAVAQPRNNPLACLQALATAYRVAPKVDRRVAIILGVSPLQQFPNGPDAPYAFQSDVHPGDGLLVAASPYRVVRKDLADVEVYWQLPPSPDTAAVFDRAAQRFWSLHLQLRGARAEMVQGTVIDALRIAQDAREKPALLDDPVKRTDRRMIRVTSDVNVPAAEPIPPAEVPLAPATPRATRPIQILLRDHGGADGDRVSVNLDGQDLHQAMLLQTGAQTLRVSIAGGRHLLRVIALDEGDAGPTTLAVTILDHKGAVIFAEEKFYLGVGQSAQVDFQLGAQD